MGIELPSFQELLASAKFMTSNATVVVATNVPASTANQTSISVNGTSTKVAATTGSVAIGATSATGTESKSLGVRSGCGYAASLLAVVSVLGMLLT